MRWGWALPWLAVACLWASVPQAGAGGEILPPLPSQARLLGQGSACVAGLPSRWGAVLCGGGGQGGRGSCPSPGQGGGGGGPGGRGSCPSLGLRGGKAKRGAEESGGGSGADGVAGGKVEKQAPSSGKKEKGAGASKGAHKGKGTAKKSDEDTAAEIKKKRESNQYWGGDVRVGEEGGGEGERGAGDGAKPDGLRVSSDSWVDEEDEAGDSDAEDEKFEYGLTKGFDPDTSSSSSTDEIDKEEDAEASSSMGIREGMTQQEMIQKVIWKRCRGEKEFEAMCTKVEAEQEKDEADFEAKWEEESKARAALIASHPPSPHPAGGRNHFAPPGKTKRTASGKKRF